MNLIKQLLLLNFYFLNIFAQPENQIKKDSVYYLDSVVVSASRTEKSIFNIPFSVDQVNKEEIQNGRAGNSLQEILNEVPGLIISDRNNPSLGERISIRGIGSRSSFGVRGIKILYDGVPLTLPDGQSQLNNIDLASAGRIEILKGPASTLYGNAAGGVINIETEYPLQDTLLFSTSAAVGSYGMQNYNLKASGKFSDFSYLISLSNQNSKGFREHSSYKRYNINSGFSYSFSDYFRLNANLNYFESPYLLNPSSLNKNDAENNPTFVRDFIKSQGAGEKVSQFQYGLSANFNFKKNTTGKILFYFADRELINPIPGRIIKLKRTVRGLRSVFSRSVNTNNLNINISAGLDLEVQDDIREEYNNEGLAEVNPEPDHIFDNLDYGNILLNQKEKVFAAGPFLSTEINFNKKFIFHAGIRYDEYTFRIDDNFRLDGDDTSERDMINYSPMFGVVYLPSPLFKIYANYSTSFQTPTTSELSNSPSGGGGFNQSLNPEKIISYEAGILTYILKPELTFEASLFFMNFNDLLISYQSQETGNEEVYFRNAGKAENKGLEIKSFWKIFSNLNLTSAYTYMKFVYKDYLIEEESSSSPVQVSGNEIPGVPKNIFFTKIFYEPFQNFSGEIKLNWVDSYYVNDFNGAPPGVRNSKNNYINNSFFKIDFLAGYNFQFKLLSGSIFFGVNNILDSRYNSSIVPNAAGERYFEPAPGINYYSKLLISF